MTLAKDVKQGKLIEKIFKVDKPVIDGDVDDPNAPLIFTITTDVVDREGDVVMPSGIMVGNYKNNAVMQWAHKYDELPIGKSVEMWANTIKSVNKDGEPVDQAAIQAAVVFQPDSNYHESYSGLRGSMVRRMYLTGFLNAVSIGFDPQEWEELEKKIDEGKGLIITSTDGTRFLSWELLEFSAVPVPANPQALMQRSKEFGIDRKIIKLFLAEMTRYCTEEDGCPMKQKGITDQDKADLVAAFDKENLVDLSAYHRRLHMMAAQGNIMTGFSQSDMDWLHAQNEAAMCKLHKADKPPTKCADASPLEWKKSWGVLLTLEDAKCSHVTDVTERIREREEAKKPPKSFNPEEDDMTKEQVEGFEKRISELEAAMKAGRVLSQANEKDLSKANDMTDQAGELIEGVLDQVGGTYNEPAEPDANAPALPETGTPAPPKTPPKEAETIEVKELTIGSDDDEIEVDVDTLLTVINEETKEPDDDEIVEVSETDLLAVINEGSTEEV
jgi:hypothetical protein